MDLIGTKGGLYVKDRAVQHAEEIDDIVRELRKSTADNDEKAFKEAFIRMSSIGDNSSFPLLGKDAAEILNVFRSAGAVGTYNHSLDVSQKATDDTVDVNARFMGRDDITIVKYAETIEIKQPAQNLAQKGAAATGTATNVQKAPTVQTRTMDGYKVFSGDEELLRFTIEDKPDSQQGQPDDGLTEIVVKNSTRAKNQDYKKDIPTQYVTEMVNAWSRAYQRNKDRVLAEVKKQAKLRQQAIYKQNSLARAADFVEKNESGFRADSEYIDENRHSERIRIAGGTNECYGVELANADDEIDTGEGIIDTNLQSVNINTRVHLGDEGLGPSSNDRPVLEVDAFYQGDKSDITRDMDAPQTVTDPTGQFDSTTSDNVGEEETARNSFGSLGGKVTWSDGQELNVNLYHDRDKSTVKGSKHITIVDNWGTGIFPGDQLDKDVGYEAETEVKRTGIETFGQIKISDSLLIPFLAYEKGIINIDTLTLDSIQGQTSDNTERDFDEFRAGLFYRLPGLESDPQGMRILAGLDLSIGNDGNEHFDEWGAYASAVFAPNDFTVFAPRLNYHSSNNAFNIGMTLVAGGSGTASESIEAVDGYLLGNFYDGLSRQFTSEMDASRRNFRFFNGLAKEMDANYALDIDIFSQDDMEGEPGIGYEMRNLFMIQHFNNAGQMIGKTGFDLDVGFDNMLDQFKLIGGVGHYGNKWYSRLGVGGTSDSDDILYQFSAGINF